MNVVIVIATYNEADNIKELLEQLTNYKVILVDDNSPDGTAKIARRFSNVDVVVRDDKKGIATAYKTGFKKALEYNPEFVVQMDAGLTHNPKDIERLVRVAKEYSMDLVGGTRFLKTKVKGYRTFISLAAAALMRFIHIQVSDATCGYRCWRADLLQKIIDKVWISKGFAFQLETLSFAAKFSGNNKIALIPIEYKLTNSSLDWKIFFEAVWVYSILLLS